MNNVDNLDPTKIKRIASTLLTVISSMPEDPKKIALLGGLDAILEESVKPLPVAQVVLH